VTKNNADTKARLLDVWLKLSACSSTTIDVFFNAHATTSNELNQHELLPLDSTQ